MTMEGKKVEVVLCPYCNKENTIPEGVGVAVVCSYCGKKWFTPGIDVFEKNIHHFYDDLEKQNKRELESRKDEN